MSGFYKIEKLDHFGKGIARLNNKVLFVENALDGELVEVELKKDKKKSAYGVSLDIVESSSDRKTPECPYYNNCGGCNIMHMNYRKQLDFKLNKVREILERFAGVDKDKVKEILSSNEFNYRNKATFKVGETLSYCKNKSYELISIDKCLLCSEKINEIVNILNNFSLAGIDEVIIRTTVKEESMVIFKVIDDIDKEYFIRNLENKIDTLVIIKDGVEDVLFGKGYITVNIGDYHFRISPRAFFQVNTNGALKIYDTVKKYADLSHDDTVLDLYCGTGTIGMYVSGDAKRVIGIEINEEAVKDAERNKELNGVNNIEFVCRDANKIITDYSDVDLIIVDPPRSGLIGKSIQNIIKVFPKKLIYVSCDPATLARDLNILKEYYSVEEVTLVDMFPNTYHCESITVLERR